MIEPLIIRATLRNLVKQAALRKEAGYRRGPHISGEEALARLTKRAKKL
jgi:hypothetical protein